MIWICNLVIWMKEVKTQSFGSPIVYCLKNKTKPVQFTALSPLTVNSGQTMKLIYPPDSCNITVFYRSQTSPEKKKKCACLCVCACVHACVRVCVCARAHVCTYSYCALLKYLWQAFQHMQYQLNVYHFNIMRTYEKTVVF